MAKTKKIRFQFSSADKHHIDLFNYCVKFHPEQWVYTRDFPIDEMRINLGWILK